MRIRYYVLAKGQQFEVFREDVRKGEATLRSRATELGTSLARLEARLSNVSTEVLVDDGDGRLEHHVHFGSPLSAPDIQMIQVGAEHVLIR